MVQNGRIGNIKTALRTPIGARYIAEHHHVAFSSLRKGIPTPSPESRKARSGLKPNLGTALVLSPEVLILAPMQRRWTVIRLVRVGSVRVVACTPQ